MDNDNICDQNFLKIKEKLNRDQIKLWLPPYLNENQDKNEDELNNLAELIKEELSIPSAVCLQHLLQLQAKALNNLKERNNYRETGQASLKVRIPNNEGGRVLTVSIALSCTGLALKEEVSKVISVPARRLKIIFKGQFLKDEEKLDGQGVKHGLHMMAVVLRENSDVMIPQYEKCIGKLDSTKADIELLSDSKYFQVADQSGKLLKLPQEEKKSLIRAMTLHEKGRVALKEEDYAFALIMLLEAEKEFHVDNYGVLSLDIVWCYLNLQSVTQLPDAEERLIQCEQNFIQSYGANLERLTALKGFTGNEAALFMRLHLLQAIVLYHQNRFNEARVMLQRAEDELKKLQVDDSQLCQLMELGYGVTEARLALRASRGDINAAVVIIDNKRLEKKQNEEMERQERKLNKKRKKLGKCLNGEWIDPDLHNRLMSMGYSFEASRWALSQSNNDINVGINLINGTPDVPKDQTADIRSEISPESLQKVIDSGFDPEIAMLALKKHNGDSQKAIDELIRNEISNSNESNGNDVSGPSTSELKRQWNEAYMRLAEGFSQNVDDHLDLNLVPEAAFLHKYKEFMNNE